MVRGLGIEGKVYAGIFAVLPEKVSGEAARKRFSEFSLFPTAGRDIAVVVDGSVAADDVRKQLAKIARAQVGNTFALESVQIFDVYQGKGLPDGKKSLAFSLGFRASDRTLTDEEVNAVFQKIQDELTKDPTLQIRR